jgi:diguanylate cyclase (GGDEF)-like protein
MSAPPKALLITGATLAVSVLMLDAAGWSDRLGGPALAAAAGIAAAALIGLGAGLGSRREEERAGETATRVPLVDSPPITEPRVQPPTPIATPRESPRAGDIGRDDDEVVTFIQRLVAATSHDQLREVVARHLPALIGTRRVWVASHQRGRRRVIVPEPRPDGPRERVVQSDTQEWTTFALRTDAAVVGVMGVEGHALAPHVKRRIERIAPVIAQVLQNVQAIDTLREASLVDLLTGAATRREGLSRLRGEIKRSNRTGSTLALLMLDLDQFKSLNDRFGHATGDAVLTAVGRTMLHTLRASDIRCRWGGEEFLIVLPDTDLARAEKVANGLLRNIGTTKVPTPIGPTGTTVSIGLTTTQPGETDLEGMIRRADMALYAAKRAGRACVRIAAADVESGDEGGDGLKSPPVGTVPFPDRRNPERAERRGVPSPGRRSTDPRPRDTQDQAGVTASEDRRVRTTPR